MEKSKEVKTDDDGWEEFLTDFEDDPSLTYTSPHPVGYWIAKQLEENKEQHVRSSLKEGYDYEKGHIADPSSYSTTKPDIEIRYEKLYCPRTPKTGREWL